ncbi:MAG: hypothetical protein IT291_10620 [Deltaproteobacteria bacterium]|nr:hypothetical protein [Deltaproteobacteria bacterium]
MSRIVRVAIVYAIVPLLMLSVACLRIAHSDDDKVEKIALVLGMRHMTATVQDLERMAGGEDELVKIFLELRKLENRPFVGVRAEKFLLGYADKDAVQTALIADMESKEWAGHARLIAKNIDVVKNTAARRRLALGAVSRAKKDPEFIPHARGLIKSSDVEISKLARESFSQ